MPHYRLEHVKTYLIDNYSDYTNEFGFKFTRAEVMWDAMYDDFKSMNHVGMIIYNDDSQETLGSVNINAGVCDDCTIDKELVKRIELFKLI